MKKEKLEIDELGNEITDFNREMGLEERRYHGRKFDDTR